MTPYRILSKKIKFENIWLTESIRVYCYLIIYGLSIEVLTLFCLEFESSAKGTSISELQNIKIQRDNYNVYTFKQDKYKYIL